MWSHIKICNNSQVNDEVGVRSEAKIDQFSYKFHMKFFIHMKFSIQIRHESSLQKVPKILRTLRLDNYFPLFIFKEESK